MNQLLGDLSPDQTLLRIFLWQAVGQLLSGALAPYFRALEYKVNARTPNAVLPPDNLALAVVRTFMAQGDAAAQAAESGIDGERFQILVDLAGLAPAPEALAEAERRGFIPHDAGDPVGVGFVQGIAQGDLANKWGPVLQKLALHDPSPVLALSALLKGQADHATAIDLYEKWGGNPEHFDIAFHTEGEGPSPVEAGRLAHRGIIPWTGTGADAVSYEQSFLESQYRNKWRDAMRRVTDYLPPPRTVTAMLREGAFTDEQATALFQDSGLTPELAAAYVDSAHKTKKATAHELARTTIEALYRDRLFTRPEAADALAAEGWSSQDADYLLSVTDLALHQQTVTSVITKLRTLYEGFKITRETAVSSLETLGVVGQEQSDLLGLWDLARVAETKALTAAEVVSAVFYKVLTTDDGIAQLVRMGYLPHDAWVMISVRLHGPQPNEPAADAAGSVPGFQT
ncbi:MAG TPA: hypothetical protein VK672_07510 [Solirubrobacteraceae bacterium]|nr:hypothetical protein [Solirubrobacteraceae bacterium]